MSTHSHDPNRGQPKRKRPSYHLMGDEKGHYVRKMFSTIAGQYDRMNSILSLRMHHKWRQQAISIADIRPGQTVLDVATGTGDMMIEAMKRMDGRGLVIGLDFVPRMLEIARKKLNRLMINKPDFELIVGDAMHLPFADASFDVITIGFGLRNVVMLEKALEEFVRVLKPEGRLVVLEFNHPRKRLARIMHVLYCEKLLPVIGRLFSGSDGYAYLPASIRLFPGRRALAQLMHDAGLRNNRWKDLTLGYVVIHHGSKTKKL